MAFDTLTICAVLFLFAICGALMLFLSWKLFKGVIKMLIMMLVNTAAGLIALAILYIFGVHIPLTLPILLSIALFGLAGLGTILIMMYFNMLK